MAHVICNYHVAHSVRLRYLRQVFVNMTQPKRYEHKLPELIDAVRQKVSKKVRVWFFENISLRSECCERHRVCVWRRQVLL